MNEAQSIVSIDRWMPTTTTFIYYNVYFVFTNLFSSIFKVKITDVKNNLLAADHFILAVFPLKTLDNIGDCQRLTPPQLVYLNICIK